MSGSEAALAAAFARDGIVILPGFFSETECAGARRFLDTCEAEAGSVMSRSPVEYTRRFETKVKGWTRIEDPATAAMAAHRGLAEVTAAVLGMPFEEIYGVFAFGTTRGCGQGWHQDTSHAGPGQFCLNRLIYPREISPEQGALWFAPGSHHEDIAVGTNHGALVGEVALAPSSGTLVLMHSRCAHRVGRNETDQIRLMLNARVQPVGAAVDLTDFARFRTGTWQHSREMSW